MADYSPEVKRILRASGCYFHRQGKGDHEIWYSPKTNRYFPVDPSTRAPALAGGSRSGFRPKGVVEGATGLPVGLHNKILSRHTANGILKQAGLPKEF
ncbi:MAG: type II toxin-antitoxin system HicA family toxin [Deltaproteobacteria bacterium]|nr:type II toxin-antitoxin system HicA family toxin [Deltaproteobacteria bacterium]